jgi:hypothetical protein
MGKREEQRRGRQQQHRPKPPGFHFETHPHPSKA